jgi:hypothetical protein
MPQRSRIRKLPVSVQRELELATAVARDAVFALHTARAEALIQLAGDRVRPPRMLEIYTRIHGLPETDAHFLTNRVLADIGRRVAKVPKPPPPQSAEPSDELQEDETPSLLRQIRERLRGRMMHDLRRGVELYAGITEVALLKVHVKHAMRFVEILQPLGEPIDGALEVYKQTLGVRPGTGDMLYFFVLERIAAEQPPILAEAQATAPEAAAAPADAAPKSAPHSRPKATKPGIFPDGSRRAHAV